MANEEENRKWYADSNRAKRRLYNVHGCSIRHVIYPCCRKFEISSSSQRVETYAQAIEIMINLANFQSNIIQNLPKAITYSIEYPVDQILRRLWKINFPKSLIFDTNWCTKNLTQRTVFKKLLEVSIISTLPASEHIIELIRIISGMIVQEFQKLASWTTVQKRGKGEETLPASKLLNSSSRLKYWIHVMVQTAMMSTHSQLGQLYKYGLVLKSTCILQLIYPNFISEHFLYK